MARVAAERGTDRRALAAIILFGLVGQIAWCIENSFLNLFVYRTITTDLLAVSAMVSSSAIVATFATIVMGWVSDRAGRRRPFMAYGHIAWGASVMAFSLITIENMQAAFSVSRARAIVLASAGVAIADCVMTFFGSAANDAAFNAYVTDQTSESNRGRIEALLSLLAALAYLILYVPFEAFGITKTEFFDAAGNPVPARVEGGTEKPGNWTLFFCLLGGAVMLAGAMGLFFLKDRPDLRPKSDLGFRDLLYGFRPSVMKRNKFLYLMMSTVMISNISVNCFGNFMAIYLQNTLRCDEYATFLNLGYLLPLGIGQGLAVVAGIAAGAIVDKMRNKLAFVVPAILASCVGSVVMFFASPRFFPFGSAMIALFCVGNFIQAVGAAFISVVCLSGIRNLTPPDKVGCFQGARMVFVVMVPMVIGSIVSGAVASSDRYVAGRDEFGHLRHTCPPVMFLLAAGAALLALLPAIPLIKAGRDRISAPAEGVSRAVSSEARPDPFSVSASDPGAEGSE